jgi:biotin synthase
MDIIDEVKKISENAITKKKVSKKEAEFIANIPNDELLSLFYGSNKIRKYFRKNDIHLCSIVNAKSGNCTEDCKFCAQSGRYNTNVKTYSMLSTDKILEIAKSAEKKQAKSIGIVTSGEGKLTERDKNTILEALNLIGKETKLRRCASLGFQSKQSLSEMKKAGLKRYHHNIETSKNFFKKICTTHTYDEKVETIKNAKELGLEVCSGGIFGLGENFSDRIEMAFELKELDVDAIPLNFLIPIVGTPFENNKILSPQEILKIIALFRFILPDKEIKVCAGRTTALKTYQPFIFYAGADSIMIGNYLTISGNEPMDDIKMLDTMGLEY